MQEDGQHTLRKPSVSTHELESSYASTIRLKGRLTHIKGFPGKICPVQKPRYRSALSYLQSCRRYFSLDR